MQQTFFTLFVQMIDIDDLPLIRYFVKKSIYETIFAVSLRKIYNLLLSLEKSITYKKYQIWIT